VAGSGYADEVIAAVEGAAATSEVDTDAPLVIMRRTNSVVREALQAGGTRVEVRVAAGASWIAAAAADGR
jgi:2-methylisocitrate lyase-like PEP mutase family enzyme